MLNSGQEARINDALKQLGEEYRLGMVQLAEYRSRRKMLVESWGELEATTSPRSLHSRTATAPMARPRGVATAAAQKKSAAPLVIASVAVIALAVGAWIALRPAAKTQSTTAPGPAMAPLSSAAAAVNKAADDFVARNVWDAAAIQAFEAQWQALTPADRDRVIDEPPLRTLRSRLDQNIQAEMQLITPETKPEERAQLTLLQDFSRILTGPSP